MVKVRRATTRIDEMENAMKAVLSDVVVIDLSRVLAGPYCTMMLGDLDPIKVLAFLARLPFSESRNQTKSAVSTKIL
jgi:hypothetical protein